MRLAALHILISVGLLPFQFIGNVYAAEKAEGQNLLDQSYQEYLRQEELRRKSEETLKPDEIKKLKLVEVEPLNIVPSEFNQTNTLLPYKIRRSDWGASLSVGYSLYKPINYESDFYVDSFENLYGTAGDGMIEASLEFKWNFALGSLGAELGYGVYENNAEDTETIGNASLSLQMIRVGARYTINNYSYEPRFAPYIYGGGYTLVYEESQPGNTQGGTTQVAPYYGFGVLFQLGWLDPKGAITSYAESGVENTFLYAEARQYLESGADLDPDFSTDLDYSIGVNVEF